jgi:hypothetical protein
MLATSELMKDLFSKKIVRNVNNGSIGSSGNSIRNYKILNI